MMTYLKKRIALGMALGVLFLGIFLPAQSVEAASVTELLARIQELVKQVDALRKQLEATTAEEPIGRLSMGVRYGIRNDRTVRNLQKFLIERGYLGRGLATGNFFTLTRDALKTFQRAKGISVTGELDTRTREVINSLLQEWEVASTTTAGKEIVPIIKTATSTPAAPAEVRPEHRLDPRPAYAVNTIERLVFDAVNAERQKNGLAPLQWSDQIAAVARAHSVDQAGDNAIITDPAVGCLYPLIRHEGFASGFKVGDRLENVGIDYRLAGENIIILPMTKELIYQAEQLAPACATAVEAEGLAGETSEAAYLRIQKILNERIGLMQGQEKLNWVNKEWKSAEDIAAESAMDWMNSPGHRHNILTGEFAEGGMGAAIVNDYIILTQVFLKK